MSVSFKNIPRSLKMARLNWAAKKPNEKVWLAFYL
jgi:hypothetical protein